MCSDVTGYATKEARVPQNLDLQMEKTLGLLG